MIEAMQFYRKCRISHCRKRSFLEEYQQLTEKLNLDNKVKFLGNLHPDDLRKITEKKQM